MQVHINTETKTVTMSLEDFTRHFSESNHQIDQQQISSPIQRVSISSDIEQSTTNLLIQLGVTRGILGFKYLRESIIISIENPSVLDRITKELYPSIAKTFKTTASRAERAIRHAIEISWNNADISLQDEIFGYSISATKGKATNTQFIAAVSDYLRLKLQSKSTTQYETTEE